MKFSIFLVLSFCGIILAETTKPMLFEDFINEELTPEEVDALSPIFETLRVEYEEALLNNINQTEEGVLMFNILQNELEKQVQMEPEQSTFAYNINLPTSVELLIGQNPNDPVYEDVKTELDEIIANAEESITGIVLRANEAENELAPPSTMGITNILVKLLLKLFRVIGKVIRAAYCTYTHIQEITGCIKEVQNKTKKCGQQTIVAIAELRQEVQQSIDDVISSVRHVGKMVNQSMGRKTVIGKIFALMFNVGRIYDEIAVVRNSGSEAISTIAYSTPGIIRMTKKCQVQAINETIHDVKESVIGIKLCLHKN